MNFKIYTMMFTKKRFNRDIFIDISMFIIGVVVGYLMTHYLLKFIN